jgi:hypothetical protein
MSNQSNATSSGIGFGSVLFLIFMTLKLTGVIHWPWWWVTAPLWGGIVLVLGIMLIVLVFAIIGEMLK